VVHDNPLRGRPVDRRFPVTPGGLAERKGEADMSKRREPVTPKNRRSWPMEPEVGIEALQEAVEEMHRCKASYKGSERVKEEFRGERVWGGNVHTFALSGHATANTCYAWSAPVADTNNRRFFAVLNLGPVQSARDAVRASIVQTYRDSTQGET
jgi:hypothetical protein